MADYGGGGGSAIDAAAAAVLSQNEVLLAAPNNAKLTALYPTPGECSSSLAQTVCNSGQLRVTANARNLGGSSNFHISSSNILDVPMLNFTLTIQGNPEIQGVNNSQYPYYIMPCQEGWGYSLIRSIEVTFSNSNLSNLILDGYALREWTLAQCKDRKARKTLLRNAGRFFVKQLADENTTVQVRGCIPLSFLSWQGGDIETGFPFDARTVNGIIQLQVNWVPNLNGAFSAAPADYPTSNALNRQGGKGSFDLRTLTFDELYVSFRSYQLMDSAFSVGNALALNPQLKYVLPGKWANTYRQNVVGAALGLQNPFPECTVGNVRGNDTYRISLELNSCPAGMLQAIGIAVRPTDNRNVATKIDGANFDPVEAKNWFSSGWNGIHTDSVNYQGSMLLNGILLQYSGQNIINLASYEEIMAYMRHIYGGDELETYVEAPYENLDLSTGSIGHSKDIFGFPPTLDATFAVEGRVAGAVGGAGRPVINSGGAPPPGRKRDQIYLLPLMHNGKQCFKERHFENLPQYSGSSLTLQLDVCQDSLWKCHRAPSGNFWSNNVAGAGNAAPARAAFNVNKTAAPVAGGISGGEICNAACEMTVPPMFVAYNTIPAAYGAATDVNSNGIHTKIYTEFEVTITYYIASLLQNANGMVELQI